LRRIRGIPGESFVTYHVSEGVEGSEDNLRCEESESSEDGLESGGEGVREKNLVGRVVK
jgi:hypothetical protein